MTSNAGDAGHVGDAGDADHAAGAGSVGRHARIRIGAAGPRYLVAADLARLARAQEAVATAAPHGVLSVTADRVRLLLDAELVLVVAVDGERLVVRATSQAGSAAQGVTSAADLTASALGGPSGRAPDGSDLRLLVDGVCADGRHRTSPSGELVGVPLTVGGVVEAVVVVARPNGPLGPLDELDAEVATLCAQGAGRRLLKDRADSVEDRVRSAVAGAPDEAVLVSRHQECTVVTATTALETVLGTGTGPVGPGQLTGRGWSAFDADGRPMEPADYPSATVLRTGQAVHDQLVQLVKREHPLTGPAAEPIWFSVSSVPVPDPLTGRPASAVTRLRDVTAAQLMRLQGTRDAEGLELAQRLAGLGWWSWVPATGVLQWSDQMYRQAGLDPAGEPMTPERLVQLVHPDDVQAVTAMMAGAGSGAAPTLLFRQRRADGAVRTMHSWVDVQRDAVGTPVRLHGATFDITDQVEAQQALDDRESAIMRVLDQAPYGVVVVGRSGAARGWVLRANHAVAEMLGTELQDLRGPVQDMLRGVDGQGSAAPVTLRELEQAWVRGERLVRRLRDADDQDVHVWVNVTEMSVGRGREPYLVVHVLDVTAQFNQQRALERLALHDPVTGLANRSLLTVRLDRALVARRRGPLALLMIDLDRFKTINDSLGHHVGDLLLQEVGARLDRIAPPSALVARQGGDEFVVLWDAAPDEKAAHALARALVDALGEPYLLRSGHTVSSTVSVGVALAGTLDDVEREDLARQADLAMYRAKAGGGNRWAACDSAMLAAADRRLDSETRLRRAMESGGLRVHLQPIVRLRDGRTTGVEALLRVQDPELGVVGPDDLIVVAEESGLIVEVDLWVLERALQLVTEDALLRGPDAIRLSVNMSCRTLEQPGLADRLSRLATAHGVDPRRLTVEITERTLLADSPAVRHSIDALQALGVHLAIDDFGTGYSALAYLQHFDLDVLKIDQSFVHQLENDPERARITLGAIITLAHAHGLTVVGEGVESLDQADVLRELGCDLAQGWLFGAAAPPQMAVSGAQAPG